MKPPAEPLPLPPPPPPEKSTTEKVVGGLILLPLLPALAIVAGIGYLLSPSSSSSPDEEVRGNPGSPGGG